MTPGPAGKNWSTADELGEAPAKLYYATVEEFVDGTLALDYRRHLDGRHRTWCPQWWRHPEAIVRLEALWRAWEHLRLQPATGISDWYRDHADHHMPALMDPDGPFRGCSMEEGHHPRLAPWRLEPAPEGTWQR